MKNDTVECMMRDLVEHAETILAMIILVQAKNNKLTSEETLSLLMSNEMQISLIINLKELAIEDKTIPSIMKLLKQGGN